MSDSNEPVVVDVTNTDDLNAFEDAFYGRAKPQEEVDEVVEDVTDVEDTDAEEDETDTPDGEEEGDEAEDEGQDPEPAKKPNRKSAKERISELSAKAREAEAARLADKAAADARIAALEARLAQIKEPEAKPAPEPEAPKADDRPNPDAVDANGELVYPLGRLDPEFAADTVRWTMKQERAIAEAEAKARQEATEAQAAEQALLSQWEVKLEATEQEVPELRTKIAALETHFVTMEPEQGIFLTETIMGLDRGPEVLLYLADNIGEAEAIVAASPRAALLALGRIEARLPGKEEKATAKVTNAPNPPSNTPRGNGASRKVPLDTDDLEAFEREFYKRRR